MSLLNYISIIINILSAMKVIIMFYMFAKKDRAQLFPSQNTGVKSDIKTGGNVLLIISL